MNCPICGSKAYIGLNAVECLNFECQNYVAVWENNIPPPITEDGWIENCIFSSGTSQ